MQIKLNWTKLLYAAACGVGLFMFDFGVQVICNVFFDMRTLHINNCWYWWLLAVVPIWISAWVLTAYGKYRYADCPYLLVSATMQFLLIPILYGFQICFDHCIPGVLLYWINLQFVMVRTVVVVPVLALVLTAISGIRYKRGAARDE